MAETEKTLQELLENIVLKKHEKKELTINCKKTKCLQDGEAKM